MKNVYFEKNYNVICNQIGKKSDINALFMSYQKMEEGRVAINTLFEKIYEFLITYISVGVFY